MINLEQNMTLKSIPMKSFFAFLIATLLTTNLMAQCDKIFDFKEGSHWTWSNYDKKGKLLGKTIQKVDKFSIDGPNRTAVLTIVTSDKNGEQTAPVSMEMSCKGGVIYVDMRKFLPEEYLQDENMELSVDAKNIEMPENMKVGDKLKDASVAMKMSGDSPMAMNMSVDIVDRKVVAEEKLNTSAGEFNCLVLQQKVKTKMMMSFEMETKEWYTVGVGMIKSETYRKGKLSGYSLLTTFKK